MEETVPGLLLLCPARLMRCRCQSAGRAFRHRRFALSYAIAGYEAVRITRRGLMQLAMQMNFQQEDWPAYSQRPRPRF